MDLSAIKTILNFSAAVAALVASLMWWRASTVLIRPRTRDDDGWSGGQVIVSHEKFGAFDPFETGVAQSKWNAWAAMAASVAAVLQGVVLLI